MFQGFSCVLVFISTLDETFYVYGVRGYFTTIKTLDAGPDNISDLSYYVSFNRRTPEEGSITVERGTKGNPETSLRRETRSGRNRWDTLITGWLETP